MMIPARGVGENLGFHATVMVSSLGVWICIGLVFGICAVTSRRKLAPREGKLAPREGKLAPREGKLALSVESRKYEVFFTVLFDV
jgi:hypothetical protein